MPRKNGPEFIAVAVKAWLAKSGVATLYSEPGSPWENAYGEALDSRLTDEVLDREGFSSLREARVLPEGHRRCSPRRAGSPGKWSGPGSPVRCNRYSHTPWTNDRGQVRGRSLRVRS
jgi:hypothetical protein